MKYLLILGIIFGIAYAGAFYFSFQKVGVTMSDCYMNPQIKKQLSRHNIELLNHCVMREFNSIDHYFFPDGIEKFEMSFD